MMYSTLLTSILTFTLVPASAVLVHGADNSQAVSTSTYSTALGEGFSHLVIRGYQEACSAGGQLDPHFVTNYKNARAAGYSTIDTYWFPCTGTGNHCKSYAQQLSELTTAISSNNMDIGTIWLDVEIDPTCGTWNYGTSGNLKQAQAIVAALRDSGFGFGVYSSPGEWGSIFGSQSVVLDSSVPLWFATFDNDDSSLKLKSPFGGWTTAVGKQYTDKSASGLFDLNIFAS